MTCTMTCIQPSRTQAHCGACHLTWSGVSAFDRHRRGGECLTPDAIGFADSGSGVYRAPMTEAGRRRLAALSGSRRLTTPESAEGGSGVPASTPADSDGSQALSGGWHWQPIPGGGWYSGPTNPAITTEPCVCPTCLGDQEDA